MGRITGCKMAAVVIACGTEALCRVNAGILGEAFVLEATALGLITNDVTIIDGFKVQVKDTIGAGDSHTGGILAGLSCNLNLKDSIYLANKIASIVVSKEGAATAPSLEELF